MSGQPNKKFKIELVAISILKPHPRNYRIHTKDQIEHLIESIKEFGFYRNVVISKDNFILAGHGVIEAAQKMRLRKIPVRRVPYNHLHPHALKILAGDNEIAHLAEINDRELSELLKDIKQEDISGLLGTGYDEQMLAALVFITRPASEIADFNAAAHWVGMPEYELIDTPIKIIVSFNNETDRSKFMKKIGAKVIQKKTGPTWSIWWPEKEKGIQPRLQFIEQ